MIFDDLKNLLNSNEWPVAIDPSQICDPTSELEKTARAAGILEIIVTQNLKDSKFLDFGCGEGHVAKEAAETSGATLAVGYDIVKSDKWSSSPNLLLTDSWDEVKNNGPYDAILLFDVLDHSEQSPTEVLTGLGNLLSPNGIIYIRCHPWCSRHATHLYNEINKAFIHLVFSNEELITLGYQQANLVKVIHPIKTYKSWFETAGLTIKNQSVIRENVDPFFKDNPLVAARIKNNWPEMNKFPEFQLEQVFLDFVLFKNA